MKVLLDTCVLSELRRPDADLRVRARVVELAHDQLFLSVVTIGELTKGIALLAEGRRKRELAAWLLGLEQRFAAQILPVDQETARLWGECTARAKQAGVQIPVADGLIAATALAHGLHVMTRNSAHFIASGAVVIDPWLSLRSDPVHPPGVVGQDHVVKLHWWRARQITFAKKSRISFDDSQQIPLDHRDDDPPTDEPEAERQIEAMRPN